MHAMLGKKNFVTSSLFLFLPFFPLEMLPLAQLMVYASHCLHGPCFDSLERGPRAPIPPVTSSDPCHDADVLEVRHAIETNDKNLFHSSLQLFRVPLFGGFLLFIAGAPVFCVFFSSFSGGVGGVAMAAHPGTRYPGRGMGGRRRVRPGRAHRPDSIRFHGRGPAGRRDRIDPRRMTFGRPWDRTRLQLFFPTSANISRRPQTTIRHSCTAWPERRAGR